MRYGFAMSNKYGRGFKRNIRFDDTAHTFCIDIRLPDTNSCYGDNNKWILVGYDRALQDKRTLEQENNKKQGNVLSSVGTVVTGSDQEQAMSTGSGTMLSQAGLAAGQQGTGPSHNSWGANK